MTIEYAELGPDCGFAVVDHARRIANYTTRAQLIAWDITKREQWERVARALLKEERDWLATHDEGTSYQSASGWLAYAASRGVSTETKQ